MPSSMLTPSAGSERLQAIWGGVNEAAVGRSLAMKLLVRAPDSRSYGEGQVASSRLLTRRNVLNQAQYLRLEPLADFQRSTSATRENRVESDYFAPDRSYGSPGPKWTGCGQDTTFDTGVSKGTGVTVFDTLHMYSSCP